MTKRKISNEKKYEIQRREEVDVDALLPVIQNLVASGYNLSDVGMILGYGGKDTAGWLYRLREKYPDIENAIDIGRNLANTELVRTAFQEATGYFIEEVETVSEPISEDKWIKTEKKTKRKYIQPNTQLLFKLLCCRMPEYFSDVRKIEVDKRTLELKGNIEDEIKQFAGALLQTCNVRNKLGTKVVEAKFEPENVRDPGTVLPTDSNESTGEHPVSDRPAQDAV